MRHMPVNNRRITRLAAIVLFGALLAAMGAPLFSVSASRPAATVPPLGDAASFSVLAALSMSAAAAGTTVSGDLGLSPGLASSRTGTWIVGGSEYFGPTGPSADAQADALIAHTNMAGQASDGAWSLNPAPAPGVWTAAASAVFAGVLTLNGGPSDVWVFQIGEDLTFTGSVLMTGGAQPCNVFWQVGNSAVIGVGSAFIGTLIASADVSLVSGATVDGRAISLNSSLTTDSNIISGPTCAQGTTSTPTSTSTSTATATSTATSTATPTGSATSTATATNTQAPPSTDTPVPAPVATDTPVVAATNTAAAAATLTATAQAVGGLPATGGAPLRREGFPWVAALIAAGLGALALGLSNRANRRRL